MLQELTLFGMIDKVKMAIDRIKAFEPPDGYYLAFSGGKDSQCIYHLAKESGVKFESHFHMTSVDPPEVISFVRERYPDVTMDRPPESMWRLIERKKIPPTRKIRYCCGIYKERGGIGRTVITGVRWDESYRRKKTRSMLELNAYSNNRIMLNNDNDEARRLFETCQMKGKHILNPIIDWLNEDVWEYLNNNGILHCCLYDEGFNRIGCIGCPMSGKKGMLREFARWPKYYEAYMRAFSRMLEARKASNLDCLLWPDAQAVMDWWIYGRKTLKQKEP
jgi:3''-phosphoadenosine 5''-phosphosulfate sulfotransferase (PAPS reductase)/FAD synthetase and related enzymes